MATEDDNFDIDIYGEGTYSANEPGAQEDSELVLDAPENLPASNNASANPIPTQQESAAPSQPQPAQANASQQQAQSNPLPTGPATQGTKRKGIDEQADPDATTALLVSELAWWETEDDIRAWTNQAGVEPQLKEVTFSEHKVNGKSKG
jgi:hypothetical protein